MDITPSKKVDEVEAEEQVIQGKTRSNWGRNIAWGSVYAALILLFGVLAYNLVVNNAGPAPEGRKAPRFTLTTFSGEKISLDSLKGKVVVVNFWASWCKPCEQEAADLEAAWQYYQPRGDVVFLGVDYTDTDKEALAYLQRFNITYENGPDLGTRISHSFRIIGVPETYIIDQNGILAAAKIGPYDNLSEIKAMIDPLLTE